jgi:hypothetical protein
MARKSHWTCYPDHDKLRIRSAQVWGERTGERRRGAMKRLLVPAMLVSPPCVAQTLESANAPGAVPARERRMRPITAYPQENPSNQDPGVDPGSFIGYRSIGYPSKAFTKFSQRGLLTRFMLRNGDPYHCGPDEMVPAYRDDCPGATRKPSLEPACSAATTPALTAVNPGFDTSEASTRLKATPGGSAGVPRDQLGKRHKVYCTSHFNETNGDLSCQPNRLACVEVPDLIPKECNAPRSRASRN